MNQTFLPFLLEQKEGHIVTVSSLLGFVTASSLSDYCASKSGAVSLHECLTAELSATSIQTTLLCPGFIKSGMFHGFVSKYPFWLKELEVEEVVESILMALESNKKTQVIFLPFYTHFAPLIRMLPCSMVSWLRNASGADDSMKKFVGRGIANNMK